MPDIYATITEADPAMQERLAGVLELRASDRQQRMMLESYTAELDLSPDSRLLEVGCGTGAVSRFLAGLPNVGKVTGVDPGELFIGRARELADDDRLEFVVGDGCELEFEDGSFDAVVCHTALCHIAGCERAISEAHRVLRRGGQLAIFDGDYAATTVKIHDHDPLQACVEAAIAGLVHDPWLMRHIEPMLADAGFENFELRGHSYIQTGEADYMLTLIERGADLMAGDGVLTAAGAEGLKAEARSRIEAGSFFGHIDYASTVARR